MKLTGLLLESFSFIFFSFEPADKVVVFQLCLRIVNLARETFFDIDGLAFMFVKLPPETDGAEIIGLDHLDPVLSVGPLELVTGRRVSTVLVIYSTANCTGFIIIEAGISVASSSVHPVDSLGVLSVETVVLVFNMMVNRRVDGFTMVGSSRSITKTLGFSDSPLIGGCIILSKLLVELYPVNIRHCVGE